MNKKLMAVAVAGALAAPVLAFAQASTVQIYGTITYEYGIADQGQGRANVDYADSPGGTAIGFRGEEKLGGGMAAWFQCETSADVRGMDQIGLCSRNSAVGFKGSFGNIFFGRWDTPMKRAMNVGTVGAEETGILGLSFIGFGGSGGADATGTGPDPQNRQRWKRREAGLTYYETPNFGGFQAMGAFSSGNAAADIPSVNGSVNAKPRVISLAATYSAGPLAVGGAYEAHNQFGAYAAVGTATAVDLDDKGWGLSAAYTFGGNVKVGATFLRREWETAPGRSLEKDVWTLGVNWAIAGPHGFEGQYVWAGDSKGNSLTSIGGNGGASASGSDTGANAFSLAYTYTFSKRTRVKLAYVRIDNDANTATNRIGNTAALIGNGQTVDAYGFHIKHTF